jgi:hypothetical protein
MIVAHVGLKRTFSKKVSPQGHRGRREMFLTFRFSLIRPTLLKPLSGPSKKGNATGLVNGEQKKLHIEED